MHFSFPICRPPLVLSAISVPLLPFTLAIRHTLLSLSHLELPLFHSYSPPLQSLTLHSLTPPHPTLPHTTPPHTPSPHPIPHSVTLPHPTLPHTTPPHTTPPHTPSHYTTPHSLTPPHPTLRHTTPPHTPSHYTTPHSLTLQHPTLPHTTPPYTLSPCTTSIRSSPWVVGRGAAERLVRSTTYRTSHWQVHTTRTCVHMKYGPVTFYSSHQLSTFYFNLHYFVLLSFMFIKYSLFAFILCTIFQISSPVFTSFIDI